MASELLIRSARVDELEALDTIAHAAKAHWGYPEAVLLVWKDDLRIPRAAVAEGRAWVAERGGRPVGVCTIEPRAQGFELSDLWVLPAHMGQGIGRALLRHAVAMARARGARILRIEADPYAEAFYLREGARRVGAEPAPIPGEPGRVRPVLELALGPPSAA